MKVLLKRFHLNGNTIGFHPQTQSYNYILNIVPCESTAEEVSFENWSHHRILPLVIVDTTAAPAVYIFGQ